MVNKFRNSRLFYIFPWLFPISMTNFNFPDFSRFFWFPRSMITLQLYFVSKFKKNDVLIIVEWSKQTFWKLLSASLYRIVPVRRPEEKREKEKERAHSCFACTCSFIHDLTLPPFHFPTVFFSQLSCFPPRLSSLKTKVYSYGISLKIGFANIL